MSIQLLFETSWEVCNKVGGIYTVLSTKAKSLHDLYKDKLIFIGPDVWTAENPSPYFVDSKVLLKGWKANNDLPEGVTVRVGRWNIPGKPIVILVKFDALYACKDALYGKMWQEYGVDSLHAYGDYDEACAFSHAAALVIESIVAYKGLSAGDGVLAHFDEWTTGMGLLHVKSHLPKAATVFTTHATCIGRSICGNNKPLYDYLEGYNGDQMAAELNMQSKHSLEKAAAHNADCFTTVSEVTATECGQLLQKRPDVVTPNGFEPDFVPGSDEMPAVRKSAREKLMKVAAALTGRKYDNNTTIIATSGRCEYRNKGIDMFLDVANIMRARAYNRNLLVYVLVPAWCAGAREELREALESQGIGTSIHDNNVLTHDIHNPESDPIYCRARQLQFNNIPEDNVTLIYVPCYLNGNDGIFNMAYYDILPGVDATVFPSYYEPWGYTPLESIAFGVPTISTSLAGFGQWVLDGVGKNIMETGVAVVERTDSNYDEACSTIADYLAEMKHGSARMEKLSDAAVKTAAKADWSYFIDFYKQAYKIAVDNAARRETVKA